MKPYGKLLLGLLTLLVVFNLAGQGYIFYKKNFAKPAAFLWPVEEIEKFQVDEKEGKLYFSLPAETPLYAAFSGECMLGGKGYNKLDPAQHTITLTFTAKDGRKLEYELLGKIIIGPNVRIENTSTNVIATMTDEKIRAVGDYNLILSLKDAEGKQIELKKKMFKARK